MPKKVDEPLKKVKEEKKSKDFSSGICENVSRTKSAKELRMKRKHNDKFNTHQVQLIRELATPGLIVSVARLKNAHKWSIKPIQTLFMRLLRS